MCLRRLHNDVKVDHVWLELRHIMRVRIAFNALAHAFWMPGSLPGVRPIYLEQKHQL